MCLYILSLTVPKNQFLLDCVVGYIVVQSCVQNFSIIQNLLAGFMLVSLLTCFSLVRGCILL